MSEVYSQHALYAYMRIMVATEQCNGTWPVRWNIPLCDPVEASHPTENPSIPPPHSVWILWNVPVVPQSKPLRAANFDFFPALRKARPSQPATPLTAGLCYSSSHIIWEECVVFPLCSFAATVSLCRRATGIQRDCRPHLFLKPFCVLISHCLLSLSVCSIGTHCFRWRNHGECLM